MSAVEFSPKYHTMCVENINNCLDLFFRNYVKTESYVLAGNLLYI